MRQADGSARERRAEQVLPVLQSELAREVTYSWNDPPLDPSWGQPDANLVSRIEAARGMLADRFASCQTMPLDEFVATAEALRKSGYRPVRFRPYADGPMVSVAAVWTITALLTVIGWALQIVDHQFFEQRRPALLDNPIHMLISPMYLFAKLFVALGFRRDLAALLQKSSA